MCQFLPRRRRGLNEPGCRQLRPNPTGREAGPWRARARRGLPPSRCLP